MDLCDRRPTARGVPRDDPDNYSKINSLEISAVVRSGSASPSIGIRCPQEDISSRGGVNHDEYGQSRQHRCTRVQGNIRHGSLFSVRETAAAAGGEESTRGGAVQPAGRRRLKTDQKRRGGDPSSGLADPDDDRAAVLPGVVMPIATCEPSARSSSLGASGGSRTSVSVPSLAPTTTGTR